MSKILEVCAKCENKQIIGNFTVMNDVDEVFQVPRLIERIKIENRYELLDKDGKHSHILFCEECESHFLADSDFTLSSDEAEECEKIWEANRWFPKVG